MTPTPVGAGASGRQSAVARAREDLAQRLGVDVDSIAVVATEEAVWRDASLGCPQPGRAYAQVLTTGVLIRLRHGDRVFEYHAGSNRGPFLCGNPRQDK